MGSRRRNLIILVLVLVLTAASIYAITAKETVLGLDLRGGTELVYQANETAKNPNIDAAGHRSRDRHPARAHRRAGRLRARDREDRRGPDRGRAAGRLERRARDRAGRHHGAALPLRLREERDPAGPEARQRHRAQTFNRLYDAVTFAGEQESGVLPGPLHDQRAPPTTCSTTSSLGVGRGPGRVQAGPLPRLARRQAAGGHRGAVGPAGHSGRPGRGAPATTRRPRSTRARGSRRSTSCSRTARSSSGDEIDDPKQESDQGGAAQRHVRVHRRGPRGVPEVTGRIAQRGAANAPPGTCNTPTGGDALSQHFAVVLDNEIVSRPIINFCENPEGIDGRTGAQISGSFSLTEAQDLAKFLQIGALPVNLTLVSQSTVSATLGEEALDQGLKAGLIGPDPRPALPDRLLPRPRPGRRAGPPGLRRLLPGDDQDDPDHPDAAGHRGPGADDRRRGRRQRRHLRANKGGGTRGQVDRLGDRHRLPQGDRDDHRRQRDHADHGLHPVRARLGRGQGLRVHPRHRDDRLAVHGGPVHAGDPRRLRPRPLHALARGPRCLGRGRTAGTSTSSAPVAGSSRSPG